MADINKVLYDAHVGPIIKGPKLSLASPVLHSSSGQPSQRAIPIHSGIHAVVANTATDAANGDYACHYMFVKTPSIYDADITVPVQFFSPLNVGGIYAETLASRTWTTPTAAQLVAYIQDKFQGVQENTGYKISFNNNTAAGFTITWVFGAGVGGRGNARPFVKGEILLIFTNVKPTLEAVDMIISGH